MGVPRAVRERYARDEQALRRLFRYIHGTLAPWCESQGYALQGRIKSLTSVSEKLGTGRVDRWSGLEDLVAFTVVIPTTSHEAGVLEKLRTTFVEQGVRGRATVQKAPETFRFDATRWYGKVRGGPTPPELFDEDLQILFEIQVKTAFENAWSTVTHDLVFKGQQVDWRGKRLVAQLKALVEQVDLLIDTFESSAESIPESRDWATDSQTAALRVFGELESDGLLDEAVIPTSWQRFAESIYEIARRRSRNAEQAGERLGRLCEAFAGAIRNGSFTIATSGSLVQAVVGFAIQAWGPDTLRRIPVVWDEDVALFYGGDAPPRVVDLES